MQQAGRGDDISDEELIKILNTEPIEGDVDYSPEEEVIRFIDDLSLVKAKNHILLKVIYSRYIDWAKKPMSKTMFNRFFKKHFKPAMYRHRYYFNINLEPFEGYYVKFYDNFFVGAIYGTQVEAENAERYNKSYVNPKKHIPKKKPTIEG